MRIDVHAHTIPAGFADWLTRTQGPSAMANMLTPHGWVSLDERADLLAAAGIDLQVLSLGSRSCLTPEAACIANDGLAEIVQQFGGPYAAFGSVPLPDVDSSLIELGRCLDDLGLLGVCTGCSIGEKPLDDPTFEPFWAEMDRRQAVAFLHPIWRDGDPHVREWNISRMVSGCFEDATATLRLIQSGVTTRYPNVRFIVPHLGGMLPFVYTRLDSENAWRRERGIQPGAVDSVAEALGHLYYDTVNGFGPALQCAREAFGVERLLFGTDYPYCAAAGMPGCVAYVEQAGLSQREQESIFHANAEQVLGLAVAGPA
jgi:aminocarboxymuconate-semialdehyde decarboxylase